MPTKTQAIKAVLMKWTHPDLAAMYHHDMECQVMVAQDKGERIEGDFEGVKWIGYTDESGQVWKPFRIPRQAATDPIYDDQEMKFDLARHVEAIGMTGWDWKQRRSRWVAFDFDAIVGHSDKHTQKLSPDDLRKVKEVACSIPWITVRHSTSGKGLHLYVYLDVSTQNHTEHSALARSILAKLSALSGFDFSSKVDICGGNMWVWHRKMKDTDGLKIIKSGEPLTDIPTNWRDHLNVVKGVSRKMTAPTNVELLSAQRSFVKFDDEHLKLIKYLNDNSLYHWWDADRHMLVTHTLHVKRAHVELELRGIFETDSAGSTSHNCFLYPMRRGGWSVRRFSPGCKEHPSWEQDGAGWTRCYLNTDPTLRSASMGTGGLEDPNGGFVFSRGDDASKAALALGANLSLPGGYDNRPTTLKPHRDGQRLIVEFEKQQYDEPQKLQGWLNKGNKWIKIFTIQRTNVSELDVENYDDTLRHLVTETGEDGGWVINSDGSWIDEPLAHVKPMLESMNHKPNDVKSIIGSSVLKPWTLTILPFQPEYPGDRMWNRRAPQFRYPPTIGDVFKFPTWMKVLEHLGAGIDSAVRDNNWCKSNGIISGSNYLKVWIASMFQFPTEPLPYLFFYSDKQNTGKSTLHEGLSLLFHPGYERVDHALQNKSTFNAELEGKILCVVEETDLSTKNTEAYARIKDWVTSPKLSIHRKQQTPYLITNTTHYIQCANNRGACPIFPGDTRITMIHVAEPPSTEIPKRMLFRDLEKEGADFLGALVSLEIPESGTRLRVPVIETQDKASAKEANETPLQLFIRERCHEFPGRCIKLADFYDNFIAWLEPSQRAHWSTKQKVSGQMPAQFPKGRLLGDSQWYWGNISFDTPTEVEKSGSKFIPLADKLILESKGLK